MNDKKVFGCDTRLLWLGLVVGVLCVSPVKGIDGNYDIPPVEYYNPTTQQSEEFYPIGWYSFGVNSIEPWYAGIADVGGNTMLLAGITPGVGNSAVLERLDWAQAAGVKVVVGIHKDYFKNLDYDDPPSYAALQARVDAIKHHSAILGWQVGDENDLTFYGNNQEYHVHDTVKLLHSWDHRQVWQVFSVNAPDQKILAMMQDADPPIDMEKKTDVASFFTYYDYDNELEFSHQSVALKEQHARATLCDTHGWPYVELTQGYGADVSSSTEILNKEFPTYKEYRHKAFSAIASFGARGFLNWIYHYGTDWYSDPNAFFNWEDDVVSPVMQEQSVLRNALSDPNGYNVGTVVTNHDIQIPNQGYNEVSTLLLFDNTLDCYYLVVTNNEKNLERYVHLGKEVDPGTDHGRHLQVTLSSLPVALASLEMTVPHDGGRKVVLTDLQNGQYQFNDAIASFGANIYVLDAVSTP